MTRACVPTCPAPRHGTESAYRQGCRNPAARRAKSVNSKRRKHGTRPPAYVPITGTLRRIQALYALGWRGTDIAEHAGIHVSNVERPGRRAVTRDTHARIVAAYERLSGTDGPSAVTRERARRKGWARPIDWDDDAMDDPAATPHIDPVPPLQPAAVDYLADLAAGLKVDEIAQRRGLQVDSVEQALRRHREREAS